MLVLASKSPRRAELLKAAGIDFILRAADVDESIHEGEGPEDYAARVAEMKALAVPCGPDEIVLAADTVVVIGHDFLGKPVDAADAERMLGLLSGRRHDVITGICLKSAGKLVKEFAVTRVWFTQLSPEEIRDYVASGEPMDKAGAYAIQGLASKFIEQIEGSYANVVGLPIAMVYRALKAL